MLPMLRDEIHTIHIHIQGQLIRFLVKNNLQQGRRWHCVCSLGWGSISYSSHLSIQYSFLIRSAKQYPGNTISCLHLE